MVLIHGKHYCVMDTGNVVVFFMKYVYVVRWIPEKASSNLFSEVIKCQIT